MKTNQILRKVAKVWAGVIIVFTVVFGSGEVINPHAQVDIPWYEVLLPISMLISVIGLGIAYRWEMTGAWINIGFYIVNYILYWVINGRPLILWATLTLGLAIVPGILYLLCWRRDKKSPTTAAV